MNLAGGTLAAVALYGWPYQQARARLLASRPSCHVCGLPGADSADHVPPIHRHHHVEGSGCCVLKPAHLRCNIRTSSPGWKSVNRRRRRRAA